MNSFEHLAPLATPGPLPHDGGAFRDLVVLLHGNNQNSDWHGKDLDGDGAQGHKAELVQMLLDAGHAVLTLKSPGDNWDAVEDGGPIVEPDEIERYVMPIVNAVREFQLLRPDVPTHWMGFSAGTVGASCAVTRDPNAVSLTMFCGTGRVQFMAEAGLSLPVFVGYGGADSTWKPDAIERGLARWEGQTSAVLYRSDRGRTNKKFHDGSGTDLGFLLPLQRHIAHRKYFGPALEHAGLR